MKINHGQQSSELTRRLQLWYFSIDIQIHTNIIRYMQVIILSAACMVFYAISKLDVICFLATVEYIVYIIFEFYI